MKYIKKKLRMEGVWKLLWGDEKFYGQVEGGKDKASPV